MISMNDFQKVGRVVSVENHPNADKLQVLRVDLGEETPRTLVAGLKGHYEPQELEGMLVVVVTNLEPVRLRGVESRGMLLAAQEGETISVVTLDKDVAPGSKVL